MNSFNILSSHVSPSVGGSTPSRSNSLSALGLAITPERDSEGGGATSTNGTSSTLTIEKDSAANSGTPMAGISDETTPLIPQKGMHGASAGAGSVRLSKWRSLPKRIAITVWNSIHWVLQTLAAPGVYLIACLYDENGNFSPLGPFKLLFGLRRGQHEKSPLPPYSDGEDDFTGESEKLLTRNSAMSATSGSGSGRFFSSGSSMPTSGNSYAVSSESESDFDTKGAQQRRKGTNDGSGRRGTAGSRSGEDDGLDSGGTSNSGSNRRSVRIKLNDDTLRQRKHRKGQSSSSSISMHGGSGGSRAGSFDGDSSGGGVTKDILAQLKSPTSPAGALTKYPRTPAPPRPLIPRRQPSFLNLEPLDKSHQKTLILDLDETLIHSMSKGGRMSTGHMVEVRLNTTFVGIGGQPSAGPQHPILYYVHKRPYCDEFLRRVRSNPFLVNTVVHETNGMLDAGMQMVQFGCVHGLGAGVRRPSH